MSRKWIGAGRGTSLPRIFLSLALACSVGGAIEVGTAAPPASAASCVQAGSTGLTAAEVVQKASDASKLPATVDATGCDFGIYVNNSSDNSHTAITIDSVTVSGANDHGIFVQDSDKITISNSTVKDNGVAPTPGIGDNKALMMVGTSDSTITGNTVTGNLADGGIGVFDDGQVDNGAPGAGTSSPASNDTISGNTVSGNYGGCGIVVSSVSANVPAAGVTGVTVSGNTLQDTPGQFGPHGPAIGGIIVAGRSMSNITVTGNSIVGAAQPGVVVHSNAPGSTVASVSITNNTFTNDDWLATNGPPVPAAIVVAATQIPPPATPVITGTTITGNTISGEFYGIWLAGARSTTTSPNTITTTAGGSDIFDVPPPGSGYWMSATDGGVFNFGSAGFYGSMGGKHLNAPVIGMAQTMDQGGYWLAAADGGVFTFGDAVYYGSKGGEHLNAPVVAVARTPVFSSQGQGSPAGEGYWLVAADGGVFTFGDAGYYGSKGGEHLNAPVVGMTPTSDGHGYWLVAADGGVFTFGDAGYYGSKGGEHLNAPVLGAAPVGITASA